MRTTSTNSGPDSKGVVRFGHWELEGEAYLYAVTGAILGIFVFILAGSLALVPRVMVALVPFGAAAAWIKYFLVGRPPHFIGDFFEGLFAGRNFNLRPQEWAMTAHPRGLRVRGSQSTGAKAP